VRPRTAAPIRPALPLNVTTDTQIDVPAHRRTISPTRVSSPPPSRSNTTWVTRSLASSRSLGVTLPPASAVPAIRSPSGVQVDDGAAIQQPKAEDSSAYEPRFHWYSPHDARRRPQTCPERG